MTNELKKALIDSYNIGKEICFIEKENLIIANINVEGIINYNIYEYFPEYGDWLSVDGGIYDCSIEEFIENILKEKT